VSPFQTLPDTKTATEFETVHTICTDNPVLKIFGGGYMYAALEAPVRPARAFSDVTDAGKGAGASEL